MKDETYHDSIDDGIMKGIKSKSNHLDKMTRKPKEQAISNLALYHGLDRKNKLLGDADALEKRR